MTKKLTAVFFLFFSVIFLPQDAFAQSFPAIIAQAAVVMDIESGLVVYSKNAENKMYPASTTKILTGIMALELGNLEDIVRISSQSAAVGEASIYLNPGDEIKLLNLLKGALIKSGNDAAYALGEYTAGNENLFVYLMNKKAILLGSENSNFCNTNGLPHDQHITSAMDLAWIARYSMHNEYFKEIVKLKKETITFATGEKRYLKNTNKLLWNYNFADGIKTGTTKKAGNCLVASATKDGISLVAVILKSYDRYGDAQKLFQYAFENYNSFYMPQNTNFGQIDIKNGQKSSVEISIPHDLAAICSNGDFKKLKIRKRIPKYLEAPVKKGQIIGNVEIVLDDAIIDYAPLVTTEEILVKKPFDFISSLITNSLPHD